MTARTTETPSDRAGPEQDSLLREATTGQLRSSGYGALRALSVEVRDGAVVLRGTVPSFHLKQVAQTAALRIQGVRSLLNLVEVSPASVEGIP